MSHHSSENDPIMERFRKMNSEGINKLTEIMRKQLGPTGHFPHGKLTEHDEGELAFAVLVKDGKVVLDFNHPVHWLGMTPEQAIELGELLIERGRNITNP